MYFIHIVLYSISEVLIVERKWELKNNKEEIVKVKMAEKNTHPTEILTQNIIKSCMFMVLKKMKITQNILAKAVCMVDICVYFSVTFCSSCLLYVSVHSTHIEDGNDGGVVPTDYGGNVLGLGDLRRDQLNMKQQTAEERKLVSFDVRWKSTRINTKRKEEKAEFLIVRLYFITTMP